MDLVKKILGSVGSLFNAVASIAPGQLQAEVGFVVLALSGLGVLHVANADAFAGSVFAVVTAFLALGVAIERVVSAYKQPAQFSFRRPEQK